VNRLQKVAVAATAVTFALIGVGALVRASGSGEGCGASWPLCSGVKPFSFHALIEESHRLLALASVVLVGVLAYQAVRYHRHAPAVFRGSIAAAVLVVAQAALGGVVVKGNLHAGLVTAHFATAMVLAATLVFVTASAFSPATGTLADGALGRSHRAFARLTLFAAAATFALLLVGAYVRGQNAGVAFADWPLMNGKLVPQLGGVFTTMFLHRILAAAVFVLALYTAIRAWTMSPRSRGAVLFSSLAVGLLVVQIMLGAVLVWSRLAPAAKVGHVVVSSLIWGALVALATTSHRVATRAAPAETEAEAGATARPSGAGTWGRRAAAYFQLTKPRIVVLLLITTVPTMVLAAGRFPSGWLVLSTLFGGTLAAAGANAMNQFFDRDIDQVMRRTRSRPLPAHRIAPENALTFGYALGVASFLWLGMLVNVLAAALALSALLFYVIVYTLLLKRTTAQNIVIGGGVGRRPRQPGPRPASAVRDRVLLDPAPLLGALDAVPGRLRRGGRAHAPRRAGRAGHHLEHPPVHRRVVRGDDGAVARGPDGGYLPGRGHRVGRRVRGQGGEAVAQDHAGPGLGTVPVLHQLSGASVRGGDGGPARPSPGVRALYPRGGICCTDQPLPSGSWKKTNEPHGNSWTSPTSTPRAISSARAAWMSATTSWSPWSEPGFIVVRPVPIAIEHADPGGVS
jgi:protoheme IX farnesyltransferase